MFNISQKFIVISGPTASGKSELGVDLAEKIRGEIVSCDSVQIYKGFDIGSAKPDNDKLLRVKHHMIDVVEWGEYFNADLYAKMAKRCLADIISKGKVPIVVGGSGLYLRALLNDRFHSDLPRNEELRNSYINKSSDELYENLKNIDPKRAGQIHKHDRFRIIRSLEIKITTGKSITEKSEEGPVLKPLFFLLINPDRSILHQKIKTRTRLMLDNGWVEETKKLIDKGCPYDSKPMQSIGYKEICQMLLNKISPNDLFDAIVVSTRRYAKRQQTWFKKSHPDIILTDAEINTVFTEVKKRL